MNKKSFIINLILGIILGISIFLVPFKLTEIIPSSNINSVMQVTGEILPQNSKSLVAILILLSIVLSLVLLVKNQRLALTFAGYVYLLSLIVFLFLNKESSYIVISYQTFRNVGYTYLFLYLLIHLIFHSVAWITKKKRKVITILGVVNWVLLLLLINFAYALVFLK